MYCKYNYGGYCNKCKNFVKTTEIKGTAERLDLIIPERALCNGTTLCICISQPIPVEVTEDSQVFVLIGTTEYPVLNQNLNLVYGDQVRSGKIYCLKFATDTLGFIYKGGWRLCPTKHLFDCVPLTPPATVFVKPKAVTKIANKQSSKAKEEVKGE